MIIVDGKYLVIWKCSKCLRTMSGFLDQSASNERGKCGSNYARGKKGYPLRVRKGEQVIPYRCTGQMVVMYDERPETSKCTKRD